MSTPWIPPALRTAAGAPANSLALMLPDTGVIEGADVSWTPCYRIIANEYAGENLFDSFATAEDAEDFRAIADLTNPRAMDEMGSIELVPPDERIYGAGTALIMAAYAWPGGPSRFSDGTQGTYYAAMLEETAIRETKFHDTRFLDGAGPVVVEKALIEADLAGNFADVRGGLPAPSGLYDPKEYAAGQAFGATIRKLQGDGILYDSVRHREDDGRPLGECAAVFRPPVLSNAQVTRIVEYHWDGTHIASVR